MSEANLKVDPDVKLPAAVRAAAAKSAEIHTKISAGEAVDPMLIQDTPEGDFPEAPQVTPQGNQEQPLEAQPAEQPAQQPAEQPAQQPAQQQETQPGEDSWEHKYKSLHGRVKQQDQALRAQGEELANLRALIATMQAAPAPAAATTELAAERLVTEEEVNEYGRDLLDVVGRRAREEVTPLLQARDQEIASLKSQLAGVNGQVQMSARDKLHAQLDSQLPEWRDLNVNEDFISWLGLPDAFSGAIRHEMLKTAYAQGNANRVLAFFKGFLAEGAAVDPQGQEPDKRTTTVAKVPLQNLAAPGKAKATATTPVTPVEKRMISRADITKFYADCSAGKYRTKEPERQKIEAEIFLAQREGRIV